MCTGYSLPSFFPLPFHIQPSLSVESPDAQKDSEYEEAEHEAGLSIEFGIDPSADIEEDERGSDDNKTPYTDLQYLRETRPQIDRIMMMSCGYHWSCLLSSDFLHCLADDALERVDDRGREEGHHDRVEREGTDRLAEIQF